MQFLRRVAVVAVFAGLVGGATGCGVPDVDLVKAIKVGDVTSGWFDAGIVDGKNKLVPSISFTVNNGSPVKMSGLQVFSVFRFLGESEELGSTLVVLNGADALAPSATSKPITVRATWGFTGEQPRGQMLTNINFRDARVEIFVKYGPAAFVKLTELKIQRQLLTS